MHANTDSVGVSIRAAYGEVRGYSMLPQSPLRTERGTRLLLGSNLHDLAILAIPSEFLPARRLGMLPHAEWMAVLPDSTEIVIADAEGKPSSFGIEKAISIVHSRAYLEARARQLLVPLRKEDGKWRLVAIDFGADAQHLGERYLFFEPKMTERIAERLSLEDELRQAVERQEFELY